MATTLADFRQERVRGARYHLANVQAGRAASEARYANEPHALQAERTFWRRAEANAKASLSIALEAADQKVAA
jgi:hypothetical protein